MWHRLSLIAAAILLSSCAAPPQSSLIVQGQSVGAITPDTTEEDLIELFGVDAVSAADVELGEGFVCHGAEIAFADEETLKLIWRDADNRAGVSEVVVNGSRWHTEGGVKLGLSLKELERINGGPFTLSGFGWDYGGTVGTWEGGKLSLALPAARHNVVIRLFPPRERFDDLTAAEQTAVSGDQTLDSDHPVMQKLNPAISDLRILFSTEGCEAFFAG